jgi:serine/threonine protein kinase
MSTAMDQRVQPFGKYQLIERLGRGGMAEVWKARIQGPAGFSRTLVVKRILPHLVEDPHFVQMFVSEARLSARLNHANIVQVFELGDVDGEYFLAMEYVRGRDLVNVVRAQLLRGLPPPGLGAFVVREVCRALAYAHQLTDERGQPLRLIHRDVSPSNVMIGFDGAVKLLDFGIAKALADANENKTVTGTLKGKFGYMSPEQVEGKDIDHRADLFAAGIVLHEVLTGKRLFKGSSDLATIAMVREAKVDPPSLLNPDVPKALDEICLKALARDPDNRWRGCDEMAVALDDVAHQMKWGPERLQSTLRELFPDEPSHSQTAALMPATEHKSSITVGALRRHQWRRRLSVVAAGLVALGGMAWIIAARARSHARPPIADAQQQSAPLVNPSPPPIALPATPSTVTIKVVTMPPGADVFLGDEALARGQSPLALTLPRAGKSEHLSVRLKGYVEQAQEITTDSDSRLVLTMTKSAAPKPLAHVTHHAVKHTTAQTTPAQPQQPKPQVPDLHRGDVVDPFR